MTDKIINFNSEREKMLKEKMKKAMEERGIKLGTMIKFVDGVISLNYRI